MSKIAVVHPDLNKKGGAEAVCLNVINALASQHNVDLITLTEPQTASLESYYELLCPIDSVYTGGQIGPLLERVTSDLSDVAGVGNLGALDVALVNRLARKRSDNYDLVVSTMSEMYLEVPSVQYIHYPNFYRSIIESNHSKFTRTYERLNCELANADALPHQSHCYVANSKWTADQFQNIYGVHPKVVYPPVDTQEFNPMPWEARENGVLIVGRIAPDKRVLEVIECFKRLRHDGYDGHLRVIGPIHDEDYGNRVRQKARQTDGIRFDGELPRSELVNSMSKYRYSIHGKKREHFGMVVAECIAAGMISFVPNSGGQTEIVGEEPKLVYDTWSELRKNIRVITGDEGEQARIRERLPDVSSQFGRERFVEAFRDIVSSKLSES